MTTKRKTTKKVNTPNVSQKPELVFNENHSILYANSVQLQMSLYDFSLTFGIIGGIKNGRLQIVGMQTVIVSPQHAKELARVLTENVQKYEEQYMSLPIRKKDSKVVIESDEDEAVIDIENDDEPAN